MSQTYYERLGVSADASVEAIGRAYRERLKEVHPDVSDDPEAAEVTKRLVEAKEVLTDEFERDRYDRLGHRRYVRFHGSFVDPDDGDVARSSPADGDEREAGDEWDDGGRDDAGTADPGRRWGTAHADTGRGRGGSGARGTPGSGVGGSERAQRRRQNRETRAEWNTAGGRGGGETTEARARRSRAWNPDAPYRVYPEDGRGLGSRLFPPGPSLTLLAIGFAIYPLMLWASLTPSFPLPINLVVGICLLCLIAFLVGMPAVGITVFGAWTVLLPAALTALLGIPPLSPIWLVGLGGTALPLGLSVLIHVALRG